MVRAWKSHSSSHSSDVLIVANFPTAKDAAWAAEVVASWADDSDSNDFDKDFEESMVYHEGKTAISSFYSESDEALNHIRVLFKEDGATDVWQAVAPRYVSVSIGGPTMKDAESRLASLPLPYGGVFDSHNYIMGSSHWVERTDGTCVYTTGGFLDEKDLRTKGYDEGVEEERIERILDAEVSELKRLGCSVHVFSDSAHLVERQRLTLIFQKECESQPQAESFLHDVRGKLIDLFGLNATSRELPSRVTFIRPRMATAALAKVQTISFEKRGRMMYEEGLVGDILAGSAEKASSISEKLHCRLELWCQGDGKGDNRTYLDGKLDREEVPSTVDLMSPLVKQFREVTAQLEKKGLSKEAEEALRLFLEMAAKKNNERYDF
jgi:hypothetical protein